MRPGGQPPEAGRHGQAVECRPCISGLGGRAGGAGTAPEAQVGVGRSVRAEGEQAGKIKCVSLMALLGRCSYFGEIVGCPIPAAAGWRRRRRSDFQWARSENLRYAQGSLLIVCSASAARPSHPVAAATCQPVAKSGSRHPTEARSGPAPTIAAMRPSRNRSPCPSET